MADDWDIELGGDLPGHFNSFSFDYIQPVDMGYCHAPRVRVYS